MKLELKAFFLLCILSMACSDSDDDVARILKALPSRTITTTTRAPRRSVVKLVCPQPLTSISSTRDEPECIANSDCFSSERCCDWFDKKYCLKGISEAPRQGSCPAITVFNDGCDAEKVNCTLDNECSGADEKCCMNTLCEYKECLSIRQNIACPVPKSGDSADRKEKRCTRDTQCATDSKCCDWFDRKFCLKGIDMIPRNGFCPSFTNFPPALKTCKQNFEGCLHDSQCPGTKEKCCFNSQCKYHECVSQNSKRELVAKILSLFDEDRK